MKTYTKRQLHKARGIRTWYLRTYEDGKTTYTSMRTTSARVAQEIVDRLNASRFFPQLAGGAPGNGGKTDIAKAAREFLDQVQLVTPKSLEPYTTATRGFLKYCEERGIETLEDFSAGEAARFVETNAATMKPVTIRSRTAIIALLFKRTAQKQGRKMDNPFEDVKLPRVERKEKDFWTMEEVARIISEAPSPRVRVTWALMGYAGLRIHEARKLGPEGIQGEEILVYGKGGKEARLPVSPRLREELDRYVAYCGGSYRATMIDDFSSNVALEKACDRAGVNRGNWCSNHKLRHSFASNLARSGCPVKVAQALMRHSSSAMTMEVYSHILSDDAKEWAGRI